MLPGERPPRASEQELADFLHEEAERIARFAAMEVTRGLPIAGTEARRRLRDLYRNQVAEFARLIETYGSEAPTLFAETMRRVAALRLSQGMVLAEALNEYELFHRSILHTWNRRRGPMGGEIILFLDRTHAEVAAQIGDVYLSLQRAEAAAFQEAALLQTIVSNLDEVILLFEPNGVMSYATPGLEDLLGYPPHLFVGEPVAGQPRLLDRLDPRDRNGKRIPLERFLHQRALAERRPQHEEALFMRRADGSDAVLEAYAAPVFDEEEALRGVVLTFRDRTEEHQKRIELERAYRELRQLHARLLARTRLEAVGGLADSAAHRLNNELNVLVLRVRKLEAIPGATEEAEAISRSVRRIASLVSKLQEIASTPEHREPSRVDVDSVVEDALALTGSELEAGGITVETRLGAPPLVVAERETLLEFVASFLLGERDVLRKGGKVVVETREEDGGARLVFEDDAPPLSPEEIDKLFEPLVTGAAPRTLSLSAGRLAINRWGGRLELQPGEEIGNRLTIHLAGASREVEAPAPRRAPAPGGARRVLVIDDDPDNAAMLADLVAGSRAEVEIAERGEEGIETAESFQPDAALVDLLLPDMDGWEVVRALRNASPEMRIAVVSGLAVGKDEGRDSLVDEVFRKPIDSDELLDFLGL